VEATPESLATPASPGTPEILDKKSQYYGTGRRKTSIARVRLLAGEGEIVVNGRSLEEHFGNAIDLNEITMPFKVTGTEGRYNAMIKVEGGGHHGQAGAIRHGIARALLQSDPEGARAPLRQV